MPFLKKEDITICITASVISRRDDNHNQNLVTFYYGRVSVMTSIHNKSWNNLCLFLMILLFESLFFGAQKLNMIKQKITADTKIFTLLYLAHIVKKQ